MKNDFHTIFNKLIFKNTYFFQIIDHLNRLSYIKSKHKRLQNADHKVTQSQQHIARPQRPQCQVQERTHNAICKCTRTPTRMQFLLHTVSKFNQLTVSQGAARPATRNIQTEDQKQKWCSCCGTLRCNDDDYDDLRLIIWWSRRIGCQFSSVS